MYCQCSNKGEDGRHIMEGKGRRSGDFFNQALKASSEVKNYIVQTEDGVVMDRLCALEQRISEDVLSIDNGLNLRCDEIQVNCAKESKEGAICGKALSLAKLPDHWHEECTIKPSSRTKATNTPLRVDIDNSIIALKKELTEIKNKTSEVTDRLDTKCDQQNTEITSIYAEIMELKQQVANFDLQIKLLETASYDGTMTWKLTEIARRRQDAIQGKTISIYSQPFYTSQYGYKMCLRVYLDGDGEGKGTHCSLFLQ